MTKTTNSAYTLIEDLAGLIGTIPPDSIVSRTFYKGDRLNAIVFGFAAGQALSEHTSSQTAVIQLVQGEATLTLGNDRHDLKAGSWLHLPPHMKHSIHAKTPLVLLLLLLGSD